MLFKVNHVSYCYRLYAEHNYFTFKLCYLMIRDNKLITWYLVIWTILILWWNNEFRLKEKIDQPTSHIGSYSTTADFEFGRVQWYSLSVFFCLPNPPLQQGSCSTAAWQLLAFYPKSCPLECNWGMADSKFFIVDLSCGLKYKFFLLLNRAVLCTVVSLGAGWASNSCWDVF